MLPIYCALQLPIAQPGIDVVENQCSRLNLCPLKSATGINVGLAQKFGRNASLLVFHLTRRKAHDSHAKAGKHLLTLEGFTTARRTMNSQNKRVGANFVSQEIANYVAGDGPSE